VYEKGADWVRTMSRPLEDVMSDLLQEPNTGRMANLLLELQTIFQQPVVIPTKMTIYQEPLEYFWVSTRNV
jgi:hypothetical protein